MLGTGIDLTNAVRRALSSGTPALPVISISPSSISHAEGSSGSTAYVYTVSRTGDLTGTSSVSWGVAGSGGSPANSADFAGGVLPSGSVSFGPAENSKTITVNVAGDSTVEPDEGFTVTLSSPVNATIGTATATGTITNDDAAPVKFLAEGDSITAYTAPDSYSRLWAADHPTVTYSNTAVGGSSLGTSGDSSPTNSMYARQSSDLAYAPTHMSVLIGANDLTGYTTSAYLTNLYNWLAPFKAAGTKIVICTVLPRTGVANWETTYRGPLNAQLRLDAGTQFDYLVDFDTCLMGNASTPSDTTYYIDGLHPTAAGHAVLKRVYATVVNHMLGIANEPLDFAFAPVSAATLDTDYDSAPYAVSGLYPGETRPYSAVGKVSKNGGAFVLNGSGTVVQGDTIKVRNHSSTSNATETDVSATIGTTTAVFSVTTAGVGTRDWVPTDLGSKLNAWLKPEDFSAIVEAGNIATWHDASGNARDFTGGGPSGAPQATATNGLNGFKAAYFTGHGASKFTPPSPSTYLSGRTSTATFFVSKNTAINGGGPVDGWGSNGDEYWPFSDSKVYSGYGSNARKDAISTGTVSLTAWHVFGLSSAASDWELWADGTQLFNTTSNVVGLGTAPQIGYCASTGTAFNGYLEEVVDCNAALTTTERQKLEGYLAWKFGLEANLPAGHPYHDAKPTV